MIGRKKQISTKATMAPLLELNWFELEILCAVQNCFFKFAFCTASRYLILMRCKTFFGVV